MADENLIVNIGADDGIESGESSQDSTVDFLDSYNIVDNDGNPIENDATPEGESKPKKETEENRKPESDEGKDPNAEKTSKPKPKTSFEKRFFKSGEDGSEQFDSDEFVKFFENRSKSQLPGNQFNQQDNGKTGQQQQPNAQQQQQPKPEDENPYLKKVKERQEYRKNLATPADIFQSSYQQARQAGYDETQSMQYARQQWQEKVEEQAAIFEAQQEEEWAKKQHEAEVKRAKAVELRTSRLQNESVYAKEFGTVDDFREFVIGRVENNQLVGGYANDVMWAIYNRDNPDNPNPTQDQFADWYDKLGSQPGMLHLLYEVALSRMQQRQWPQLVKRVQSASSNMQQQQKLSKTAKPGKLQGSPSNGSPMDETLQQFLNPMAYV